MDALVGWLTTVGGRPLLPRATVLLMTAVLACQTEREQARKSEAAALVRAIDELRDAPNSGKRPRLLELERVACSDPDLCALKRACTLAYRRHLRALESARSLRHALKGDAGGLIDASTPTAELVSQAQHDLQRARRLARRCTELEGEVLRRYGL